MSAHNSHLQHHLDWLYVYKQVQSAEGKASLFPIPS